jgi:hypothetical protein
MRCFVFDVKKCLLMQAYATLFPYLKEEGKLEKINKGTNQVTKWDR